MEHGFDVLMHDYCQTKQPNDHSKTNKMGVNIYKKTVINNKVGVVLDLSHSYNSN